ncbi:hypothetical protein GCM10023318_40140 [Nocardia callitridis]|uniref:Uncharacterized protein n=1 Tax=Nocardia callitridis TaxID=648753 RepID=A0ABP9KIK4_9NOCA
MRVPQSRHPPSTRRSLAASVPLIGVAAGPSAIAPDAQQSVTVSIVVLCVGGLLVFLGARRVFSVDVRFATSSTVAIPRIAVIAGTGHPYALRSLPQPSSSHVVLARLATLLSTPDASATCAIRCAAVLPALARRNNSAPPIPPHRPAHRDRRRSDGR